MKKNALGLLLINIISCGSGMLVGCASGEKFNDPTPPVWYHKDYRVSQTGEEGNQFGLNKVSQVCKPTASSLEQDCKHIYTLKLKVACKRDGPEFANIPEIVRFRPIDVHVKLFYPNDGMNVIQRKGTTNHSGVWFASFEDSRYSESQKVDVIVNNKEYAMNPDENGAIVVDDPMCE